MKKTVFKILRQDHPESNAYWEEFLVEVRNGMTVVSALNEIRKNPITIRNELVAPVVWECNGASAVCGLCTMLINGRVGQACSTFLHDLKTPITLEPLSKFPIVRDLVVDRNGLFQDFAEVRNWVPFSGIEGNEKLFLLKEEEKELALDLFSCTACGACLEACPQFNERSSYRGAAVIGQALWADLHSEGFFEKRQRLDYLMGEGGLEDCGNAQNCQMVCPAGIPLVSSIATMNRKVTKHLFRKLLG